MRQTPRPQKKKESGFLKRILLGNAGLISFILLLIVLGIWFIGKGKRTQFLQPSVPRQTQETKVTQQPRDENIPSIRTGDVPKRTSTKEEKSNVSEEPLTPEFVKEHVAQLTRTLELQIRGSELTLTVNNDPQQVEEIKRRIEAAKRFKASLERVKPEDPSTWFFVEDKNRPGKAPEPGADFIPKQ